MAKSDGVPPGVRWRAGVLMLADALRNEMAERFPRQSPLTDEEVFTVSDFVGIPREQAGRFVGTLRLMGVQFIAAEWAAPVVPDAPGGPTPEAKDDA